jgi:hypothetical protein
MLKIFRPERDEVIGGWRKLHNEEFHNLYSSTSIIRMIKSRRMSWAEHIARMVEKPEGQSPLGIPKHRCGDNIKMDLREIGWSVVD